jgi:hypothetical protein
MTWRQPRGWHLLARTVVAWSGSMVRTTPAARATITADAAIVTTWR